MSVGPGEAVEVEVQDPARHDAQRTGSNTFAVTIGGERGEWYYATDGDVIWIGADGWAWPVRRQAAAAAQDAGLDGDLRAPMPGQVLLVPASVGERVRAGDPVVVLESMKMELVLAAPIDGLVAELSVAVGDKVAVDQSLARVEATA